MIKEAEITEEKLLQLYDSQGIAPDIIAEEAKKQGKKVVVPDDFYIKVTELHEQKEQEHATIREEKLSLDGIPDTEACYFDDYSEMKCWNLKDYNGFAETKPRDRWDPAYFNDFDDINTVKKVGSARYNFFGIDDFERFDLYDIKPRARAEIYYHGFYEDYQPY